MLWAIPAFFVLIAVELPATSSNGSGVMGRIRRGGPFSGTVA